MRDAGLSLGVRDVGQSPAAPAGPVSGDRPAPEAKRLAALEASEICAAVAAYYGAGPPRLACRGDAHIARAVAAWLDRQHADEPLRDLAFRFGSRERTAFRT